MGTMKIQNCKYLCKYSVAKVKYMPSWGKTVPHPHYIIVIFITVNVFIFQVNLT